MEEAHRQILAACSTGNIATLSALFKQHDMSPTHASSVYALNPNLPLSQQLPDVPSMLAAAIEAQSIPTVHFLGTYFVSPSFFGHPMMLALETGNAALVRAVCAVDPSIANAEMGDDSTINALGAAYACPNAAALVEALLDGGADPNARPPFDFPGSRNVSRAVVQGLPVQTFELFFDKGYVGGDPFAALFAVELGRVDVLRVLFRRSLKSPYAEFFPEEKLLEKAIEREDWEMVDAIRKGYAERARKEKGVLGRVLDRVRLKGKGKEERRWGCGLRRVEMSEKPVMSKIP